MKNCSLKLKILTTSSFIFLGFLCFVQTSQAATIFSNDFETGSPTGFSITPACPGGNPVVSGGHGDNYTWSNKTWYSDGVYWDGCFGERYFTPFSGPIFVHYWFKMSSSFSHNVSYFTSAKSTSLFTDYGNLWVYHFVVTNNGWYTPAWQAYGDPDTEKGYHMPPRDHVTYGGKTYSAKKTNTNKRPDLNPTYWLEITNPHYSTAPAWNSSQTYVGYTDGTSCVGTDALANFSWERDRWYEVEWEVQFQNPSGAENGINRLWIDGVLMWEDLGVRYPATSANRLYITNYIVQSGLISPSGFLYTDNITLSTTRVGGGTPDTQVPTVPTNLSATAASSSQINLSWSASSDYVGVTGYRIYRCQGAGCTPTTQIATSATNSYSDAGLSPSTTYTYTVAAYDAAGNLSGQSSSASATTQAADTTPPTISSVTASSITSSGATITWTTNESSDSQVEYGLTTSYGSQTTLNTSLVTSHSQGLTSLSPSTLYHYRVKSRDAAGNLATSVDYTFTTQAAPINNLALGITPTVDSTYSGYSVTPITNGVIDAYGGTNTTWASDESSTNPHWIVIDFGQNRTVNRTLIYWAWNSYSLSWMTSQQYKIQRWDGASYIDVATVTNPTIGSLTETSFPSVTTSRIRIYQPANMGPSSYSTVMWLTELEIYDPSDTTPPAAPTGVTVI